MEDRNNYNSKDRKVNLPNIADAPYTFFNNMDKYMVVKDNELIRSKSYDLSGLLEGMTLEAIAKNGKPMTLDERKLLLYCISKIKPGANTLEPIHLTVQEACAVLGFTNDELGGSAYRHIKNILIKLKYRAMLLKYETGKESIVSWIRDNELDMPGGTFDFELEPKLAPFLLNLRRGFTSYPFGMVRYMSGKYSIPLYELLKSYAFTDGPVIIDIDYLKDILGCPRSAVERFNKFRTMVIEPAVNEINRYTDLFITVSYQKRNRANKYVSFEVRELDHKDPRDLLALADREAARRVTIKNNQCGSEEAVNLRHIWALTLKELSEIYPDVVVSTWFEGIQIKKLSVGEIVLVCETDFRINTIEEHYIDSIGAALSKVLHRDVIVRFERNANGLSEPADEL